MSVCWQQNIVVIFDLSKLRFDSLKKKKRNNNHKVPDLENHKVPDLENISISYPSGKTFVNKLVRGLTLSWWNITPFLLINSNISCLSESFNFSS